MSEEKPRTELVLITGASSGIGREMALEFAARGHALILVASSLSDLEAVAREIKTAGGGEVRLISQDLRSSKAAEEIFDRVEAMGAVVTVLVNNAGVGHRGLFWEVPVEDHIEIIRVNVEAIVSLTKKFLPRMIDNRYGRVLNTASIAGFEPGPLMAVYHASKAFVLSWSESLATELKDSGVTFTALCPGPVDTDFFEKADMVQSRAFQKGNVMGPREVAKAGVDAVLSGERVVVPGVMNKISVFTRRLVGESVQAKKNEAMYADVPDTEQKRQPGDIAAKERKND